MVFTFQRFQLALGFVFEQPIKREMLLSKWATIDNFCVFFLDLWILFGFPPPPRAKNTVSHSGPHQQWG